MTTTLFAVQFTTATPVQVVQAFNADGTVQKANEVARQQAGAVPAAVGAAPEEDDDDDDDDDEDLDILDDDDDDDDDEGMCSESPQHFNDNYLHTRKKTLLMFNCNNIPKLST